MKITHTTSEDELQERVEKRFLAAQASTGRLRLNFQAGFKRASWRAVTGFAHLLKRFFDVVIAATAIIIFAPLFGLLAILVKLDGGPVFFRQSRYGLHGREFKMLKYRSMAVDAEARLAELLKFNEKAEGITFKMKDDPRITKVGKWLRKTSLDELPQFFNVLKGEMSLVGPRPPVKREVELYEQRHRRRFNVKPGITCLWQVGEREGGTWEIGDRNAIDFEEQVDLDVRYIESQSFWKDLWLLAKTVPAILLERVHEMKAIVICPDLLSALPFFSHGGPAALVPALGPSLLGHALTRLAMAGAKQVTVLAADRPEQIRKVLGRGERWGLTIEVVAESRDLSVEEARWKYRAKDATDWLPEGQDVIVADRPVTGEDASPLTEPRRWFETLLNWLPQAHAHRVGVREIAPGVWAGMRSRIDEGAVIQGPCWLGEGVRVAAGAKVGLNALIEDGAFIDADAEVTESWVGPQTYVGAMTHVHRSFAWGRRLLSYETNSCVEVPDPFLLSELQPSQDLRPRGSALGRIVALALGVLTSPVALLAWWRSLRTKTGFCVAHQAVVPLEARPYSAVREVKYAEFPVLRGLWRRWPQIWNIVRGDFAWVGNRPLTPEQAQELTGEFEQLWLAAPVGLVSLADVEGCEDSFDDEARAHASFYAAQAGRQLDSQILRRVFDQRLITFF